MGLREGCIRYCTTIKQDLHLAGICLNSFHQSQEQIQRCILQICKNTHPTASIKEFTGGTASEPSSTETLLIPTTKWHEAYLIAQKLYDIPRDFAMPDPKGRDAQVINSTNKPLDALVRELQVTRLDNTLVEIVYNYTTTKL